MCEKSRDIYIYIYMIDHRCVCFKANRFASNDFFFILHPIVSSVIQVSCCFKNKPPLSLLIILSLLSFSFSFNVCRFLCVLRMCHRATKKKMSYLFVRFHESTHIIFNILFFQHAHPPISLPFLFPGDTIRTYLHFC